MSDELPFSLDPIPDYVIIRLTFSNNKHDLAQFWF